MSIPRSQVALEETYCTERIFPNSEAFLAEVKAISELIPTLKQYEGRIREGAAVTYSCLDAVDQVSIRVVKVICYARLRQMTDGTNPDYGADMGRAIDLWTQISQATAFLKNELIALPEGCLAQYAQDEPRLREFGSLLRQVELQRGHVLGLEAEMALESMGVLRRAPAEIFNIATTADMKFEPVVDSKGDTHSVSLMGVMMHTEVSPDTTLRRNAYHSMMKGLAPYRNTLAQSLSTYIKANVSLARLKKYKSVFEMMLYDPSTGFGSPDEVPVEVFDNVLDTFQAHVAPHFQRYARLRKKVLGLDKLYMADIKAGLDPDYNPRLEYAQVQRWIEEAVSGMGTVYQDTVRSAFRERWIDRADNSGRQGGASCTSVYGVHPFIFSVWTGSMHSAFTLAHELGHAVHGVLSNHNQRFSNTRSSQFLLEAPSCFIPQLLAESLKHSTQDVRFKRAVLIEEMNTYHHEFVTHLLEAELLRRLYRRAEASRPLTERVITAEKRDTLQKFWGDTVEVDEIAGLAWMRQPHYYMGLYPYVYSVGLTAATLAADLIKKEGQPAIDRWIDLMKAGGSENALTLFRRVGIDMATPEPLKRMCDHVGDVVTQIEATFA